MNNLTAAVIRPQISKLDEKVSAFKALYRELESIFTDIDHVETPSILPQVLRVGDSFQFNLVNMTVEQIQRFLTRAREQGIELQIFGHTDNARYFRNWEYSFDETPELQQTDDIISAACDFRIPLSFSSEDLGQITDIIRQLLHEVKD